MNNYDFYAGFARVDITPSLDVPIIGYYVERKVEGVLDNLEVNAVALKVKDKKALFLSVDNCGVEKHDIKVINEMIFNSVGLLSDEIFIHSTHTHTGPGASLTFGENDPLLKEYKVNLFSKCVLAANLALQDLKPAKMGYGIGEAKNVAFVRRFKMKDGSIQTNPGVNNPDILHPLGDVDERVNVIRIDRENAETIVFANFGNHPDTVGGSKISGDWPNFTRKFVERAIENTKCIFFNGCQGDVNHVNVHPQAGDFNDMFHDFDGCSRGYGHARHIGRVVAAGVMQVYDKVNYVKVDSLKTVTKTVKIASNKATPEQLPMAKELLALHKAGKDDQIPYKGMMLTTVVAEAKRMVNLENGPDYYTLTLTGVRLGEAYFIGLPGEPFTGIGRAIKKASENGIVLPCCIVNDSAGYFPTKEAYDEGGYEARSSVFAPTVAETLIKASEEMIKELN